MKVRDSLHNTKLFDAEAKSVEIKTLQQMLNEFHQMAEELARQVVAEEKRTGVFDMSHFAYSTYARAALQRRANLQSSINDLKVKLDRTIVEHNQILAEIERARSSFRNNRYRGFISTPA
ncbi:MAG: hypothetical protein TECD_01052 [Hyphomicrobiaceae bacterium hypho_1]